MIRLSPVLGLRPVRAEQLPVQDPEPAICTSSYLARAIAIASNTDLTAFPTADLPTPVRLATRSAMSDLFTHSLPGLSRFPKARHAGQTIVEASAHG